MKLTWRDDPGAGVSVTPFNRIHVVQWRDDKNAYAMKGFSGRWAALSFALELSTGKTARRSSKEAANV